ncbi:MAG TPA: helix-turn-helix domain-containing protein [Patescibacteria group bacterium]|nr:helix-turn-helix domain-containing protein [Patescibacteria group bacterium]
MNIEQNLQQFGLNKSETKVYLFLLEHGQSTPPEVALGTKITRTNSYNILKGLWNNGLIRKQRTGGRWIYFANDPESLLINLEKKRASLNEIIPDLRGLFATQKNKPKIRFYNGVDEVGNIYLECARGEGFLGIGSTQKLSEVMPDTLNAMLREMKNNHVVVQDILTPLSKNREYPRNKELFGALYDAKFIPESILGSDDQPTDILIWGDNIALITLEEPIFGTVITNPLLAKTFKIIHRVMWSTL